MDFCGFVLQTKTLTISESFRHMRGIFCFVPGLPPYSDVLHANFLCDGLKAISLGKDGFVKVWDVSVGELHSKFRVSQGYEPPSCMAAGEVNPNLFSVGDFNGIVALYDVRQVLE